VEATVPGDWDLEADVVVVGFGAAGACAALEAAASGAIAYVSKEHLAADTIRELWETRTSGNFVSR